MLKKKNKLLKCNDQKIINLQILAQVVWKGNPQRAI